MKRRTIYIITAVVVLVAATVFFLFNPTSYPEAEGVKVELTFIPQSEHGSCDVKMILHAPEGKGIALAPNKVSATLQAKAYSSDGSSTKDFHLEFSGTPAGSPQLASSLEFGSPLWENPDGSYSFPAEMNDFRNYLHRLQLSGRILVRIGERQEQPAAHALTPRGGGVCTSSYSVNYSPVSWRVELSEQSADMAKKRFDLLDAQGQSLFAKNEVGQRNPHNVSLVVEDREPHFLQVLKLAGNTYVPDGDAIPLDASGSGRFHHNGQQFTYDTKCHVTLRQEETKESFIRYEFLDAKGEFIESSGSSSRTSPGVHFNLRLGSFAKKFFFGGSRSDTYYFRACAPAFFRVFVLDDACTYELQIDETLTPQY